MYLTLIGLEISVENVFNIYSLMLYNIRISFMKTKINKNVSTWYVIPTFFEIVVFYIKI